MPRDSAAALLPLFRRELQLCGVRPGEIVGILTENQERLNYVEAFELAARELGATVFHVDVPADTPALARAATQRFEPLAANPVLLETFRGCDLMLDLVYLLWSEEQRQIQAAGTRVLTCREPVNVLERLFPTEDQKRRVLTSASLLRAAKTLRLEDEAGTSLTYGLGQYGQLAQYGFTHEPGRWDNFPSSLAAVVGNDGEVDGRIVLKPGDLLFPFKRYVGAPVTMTIGRGRIEAVEGGDDAALIREYMASFDDDRAYACSHVGWGLNENARWDALALDSGGGGMDARSLLGSVMFSTGPNSEFGGDNDTACHIDIPMRRCSVYLDDRPVILQGSMVEPSLQVAAPQG